MGLTLNSGFTIGPGVTLTSRLPLTIVPGARFNATSLTNWAGTTATGSPALTDGKYLRFTGSEYLTTDYIDNTTIANNDVTYEFWVRTTGTNSGCLLSKLGTSGYFVSAVEISDTTLVPGYWTGAGTGYDGSNPSITRDAWQHYTVTYTSGTLKTYYNGVLVHTANFGAEVSPRDYGEANEWFQLFKSEITNFGHGGALTGDLGEFRLYTRVLSAAEVLQNYRATAPRWGINPAPTGLTSADPSTSAYAIKQAYPNSADGLYWIQNANINSGNPLQIYADMTTDGGGWTLIMQNMNPDWSYETALIRNASSPPSTLGSINYSIIGWADYIKRSASGFDYMLEAGSRNSQGGIFTANEAYSFTGQVDLTAYAALGSGPYFGGTQYNTDGFTALISTGNGFRQNITLKTKFGSWDYDNNGLEKRMPWYTGNSHGLAGEAIFTTTHDDPGSWWGSLMDYDASFSPAPWMNNSPGIIWYWVR